MVFSWAHKLAISDIARRLEEQRKILTESPPDHQREVDLALALLNLSKDFSELINILRSELGCP